MRFNERELSLFGNSASNPANIIREGYLWKQGERPRSEYRKRWFVLKGNLLYYFKTENTEIEPLGCIVMERASVGSVTGTKADDCTFKIEFDGQASRVYNLRATDSATCQQWIECLKHASYEYLRLQLDHLRERLMKLTGHDPLGHALSSCVTPDVPDKVPMRRNKLAASFKRQRSTISARKSDIIQVEDNTKLPVFQLDHQHRLDLNFACKSLPLDGDVLPMCRLQLLIKLAHGKSYECGSTETAPPSSYPRFEKTVTIPGIEIDTSQLQCIVIYSRAVESKSSDESSDNTSRSSTTEVAVGTCTIELLSLFEDGLTSHLIQCKDDRGRFFSVVIDVRHIHEVVRHTPSLNPFEPALKAAIGQRQRSEFIFETGPRKQQTYTVADIEAHEMKVLETMEESPLGLVVGIQLLRLFIDEDLAALNELERLGLLLGPVDTVRRSKMAMSKRRFQRYSEQLEFLRNHPDEAVFKASTRKKEQRVEMIVTNLHVQEMAVQTVRESLLTTSFITAGCPSAHSLGFKNGGLYSQTLAERKRLIDAHPGGAQTVEHVRKLEMFQHEFCEALSCLEETMACIMDNDDEKLKQQCHVLRNSVDEFEAFLSSPVMAEITKKAEAARPPRAERIQDSLRLDTDDLIESMQDALTNCIVKIIKLKKHEDRLEQCRGEIDFLEMVVESAWFDTMESLRIVQLQSQIECPLTNDLMTRRDIVFSQSLGQLVSAFVAVFRSNYKSLLFQKQLCEVGFVCTYTSLLSTAGDEEYMIEDMLFGVKEMRYVKFKFSTVDGIRIDPVISGSRYSYIVDFGLPAQMAAQCTSELMRHPGLTITPVIFTQGVNEMQTIANKLGATELQARINSKNYHQLYEYIRSYTSLLSSSLSQEQNSQNSDHVKPPSDIFGDDVVQETIDNVYSSLHELKKEILAPKSKNIDIFRRAFQASSLINGGKIICCKSGKDRTSMLVTLEQASALVDERKMAPGYFSRVLDNMREVGTRRDNVEKNIGERKYAFNRLQVMTLPKLLRPPPSTIGSAVQ